MLTVSGLNKQPKSLMIKQALAAFRLSVTKHVMMSMRLLHACQKNYPANTDGQRISALYQSYLDIATRTQRGLTPLQQAFKNIDRISSREDLAIAFGQGTIYGQGSPFSFWIDSDEKKPKKYQVYLTQSGLGLPNRDYYLKQDPTSAKVRKKYIAHIQKMFEHINETNARSASKTCAGTRNTTRSNSMV